MEPDSSQHPMAQDLVHLTIIGRIDGGLRRLIDVLLDGRLHDLSGLGGDAPTGMLAWDGRRYVRVKDVKSRAGARQLAEATARAETRARPMSLISWRGGNPFNEPLGHEVWVDPRQDPEGTVTAHLDVNARVADHVTDFVIGLASAVELTTGGAWSPGAGAVPRWADRTWWIKPAPLIPGPLWLVLTAAATHRRLMTSKRARELAVSVHDLGRAGALWQLSHDRFGPAGRELVEWFTVLHEVGVLDEDTYVKYAKQRHHEA